MLPRVSNRLSSWLWLGLSVLCLSAGPQKNGPSASAFERVVQPFVSKNCYSCHNGKSAAGGLNLQTLNSPATLAENRDEWEKIAGRISSGNMPPRTAPKPDPADVKAVTTWLRKELDRADRSPSPVF